MAKIRVHELAKELGIPSKQMVETLHGLGLEVKNHMSTMEDSQVTWVRKRLGYETEPVPEKTPAKPPSKAATPPDRTAVRGQSRQDLNASTTPAAPPAANKQPVVSAGQQPAAKVGQQERRNITPGGATQPAKTGRPYQPTDAATRAPEHARPAQPVNRPAQPGSGQGQRPHMSRPVQAPRPGQTPSAGVPRPRPAGGQERRPISHQEAGARPGGAQAPRPQGTGPIPGKKPFGAEVKKGPEKSPVRAQPPTYDGARKPGFGGKDKAGKKTPAQKPMVSRDYSRPQKKGKHKRKKEEQVLLTPEKILVGDTIQVRELADKLAKGSGEIVKKLMELGIMATINQEIDFETVEILGSLYDVEVERELSQEQQILEEIVDTPDSLVPRPPIVTVMGHVDHGKTSLLDKIRHADVVSSEAGGITQHIGAYQIKLDSGKSVTFIDTPGHEAFTAMRARGANLTDIVVLVVAADDGVMPQTIEAINHIKAAKVPFLVALNKMDKPDVNPDKVMQQLTEYSIVAEEWGGDTMFIPVSAKTGMGIENLLDMTALLAEMQELKANPNRSAEGVVIEAQLDKGKGAVATVLVQKGTLKIGDSIVCGFTWCKVRAMTDFRGRRVDLAYPSMPVEITGWSEVPEVGEKVVVTDDKIAKEIASLRLSEKKLEDQKQSSRISLDDFFKQMQNTGIKELNLIIKGDVQGSIEALAQSLLRLSTNEVKVNVIHSAVGAVTETDVMLASASNAIIIGFNVRPDIKARKYGEEENIDIRMYRVIYEAIDDVKKAMEGLLEPEYREKYLGRAEVRQTFKVPNVGTIAGSYIIDGKMLRNADIRVLRDSVIIHEGKLSSLKRFKDDVKEVVDGYECGMGIRDFNDLKEGDIIEAFTIEEIARAL